MCTAPQRWAPVAASRPPPPNAPNHPAAQPCAAARTLAASSAMAALTAAHLTGSLLARKQVSHSACSCSGRMRLGHTYREHAKRGKGVEGPGFHAACPVPRPAHTPCKRMVQYWQKPCTHASLCMACAHGSRRSITGKPIEATPIAHLGDRIGTAHQVLSSRRRRQQAAVDGEQGAGEQVLGPWVRKDGARGIRHCAATCTAQIGTRALCIEQLNGRRHQ